MKRPIKSRAFANRGMILCGGHVPLDLMRAQGVTPGKCKQKYFQMKKNSLALLFVLLISQSVTSKDQVLQNDKIDPKVKTTVEALNNKVYLLICENNFEKLKKLFTDTLQSLINLDFSKKFMPNMQGVMKDKQFRVYDQFYISHANTHDTIRLASGSGDTAYTMNFLSRAPETYIAMLVSGDSINEVMLTLKYILIKGEWQVDGLYGENFTLRKKNAIEQYYYAESLQKNGYLADALNTLGLAKACLNPGGNAFRYGMQQEISSFFDSVIAQSEAKFTFPYTINEIKSKPRIMNIHYEVLHGVFVPMVVYQSTINVQDTVSLKAENDVLQKDVCRIFYGLDKANRNILYRAYNDLPDGANSPRYYGYLQTVQ